MWGIWGRRGDGGQGDPRERFSACRFMLLLTVMWGGFLDPFEQFSAKSGTIFLKIIKPNRLQSLLGERLIEKSRGNLDIPI